jgi:phage shock protein A
MRLGKRIGLLIRANLGRWRRHDKDISEAALRRADKMEALLEQLEERLNRAIARQAQLEGQVQQAEEMAKQWDDRADEALRAGDETTARQAIRHKLAYTQIASELQAWLASQTAATHDLQTEVTKLESRLARPQTPKKSPASRPAAERAPQSTETTTRVETSPDGQDAVSLEALRERMSRVWSDKEVENELEAIKSRLSAGIGKG